MASLIRNAAAQSDNPPVRIMNALRPADGACRLFGEGFPVAMSLAMQLMHLRPQTESQFPSFWKAYDDRVRQVQEEDEAELKRKSEEPERYVCAAEDCIIIANAGKALQRCSCTLKSFVLTQLMSVLQVVASVKRPISRLTVAQAVRKRCADL